MANTKDKKTTVSQGTEIGKEVNRPDIVKLEGEILKEERVVEKFYSEIGEKYYELYRDNCGDEFKETVEKINESFKKMEQIRDDIRKLKGLVLCPICKTELKDDVMFCSSCGMKFDRKNDVDDNQKRCSNCGTDIAEGSNFCTKCGAKVGEFDFGNNLDDTIAFIAPKNKKIPTPVAAEPVFESNTYAPPEIKPQPVVAPEVKEEPVIEPVSEADSDTLTEKEIEETSMDSTEKADMSSNQKICKKCGSVIIEGNLFCVNCGEKAEDDDETEGLPIYVHTSDTFGDAVVDVNSKKCWKCGNMVPDTMIYCTECGTKLDNGIVLPKNDLTVDASAEMVEKSAEVCANCGKEIPANAKFCIGCGMRIKG